MRVGLGVAVGVAVEVGTGVSVGVAVGTGVSVAAGGSVATGAGVAVETGLAVGIRVEVGTGVSVGKAATAVETPAATVASMSGVSVGGIPTPWQEQATGCPCRKSGPEAKPSIRSDACRSHPNNRGLREAGTNARPIDSFRQAVSARLVKADL